MNYLSLCLIVKDEDEAYLREWVDYHVSIGVEAFFIYDNESQIPVRQTLAEPIARGQVMVLDIRGQFMQDPAYTHCLHFLGHTTRWLAFLDGDEFIVPKTKDDLREFLVDYEAYGGLAITWLYFGSSGHETKPAGLQIENFTRRVAVEAQRSELIKSIVQPARTINIQTPHASFYKDGTPGVGEHFDLVEGSFRPMSTDKIQVNHYVVRSREQFLRKINRGRSDHGAPYYKLAYFDDINAIAVVEDRTIIDLYARTRKRIPPSFGQAQNVLHYDDVLQANTFSPVQIDFAQFSRVAHEAIQHKDRATLESVYRIAIKRYPDMPQTYSLLNELLVGNEPSLPTHPNLIWQGNQSLANQHYQDALTCFESVLKENPWEYAAWLGIQRVFSQIGEVLG